MKAEGLLECLKKDRRTKNKWVTLYKASQVCDYGHGYIREALERFADTLAEVERRERCECRIEYRVDPPVSLEDVRDELLRRYEALCCEKELGNMVEAVRGSKGPSPSTLIAFRFSGSSVPVS